MVLWLPSVPDKPLVRDRANDLAQICDDGMNMWQVVHRNRNRRRTLPSNNLVIGQGRCVADNNDDLGEGMVGGIKIAKDVMKAVR